MTLLTVSSTLVDWMDWLSDPAALALGSAIAVLLTHKVAYEKSDTSRRALNWTFAIGTVAIGACLLLWQDNTIAGATCAWIAVGLSLGMGIVAPETNELPDDRIVLDSQSRDFWDDQRDVRLRRASIIVGSAFAFALLLVLLRAPLRSWVEEATKTAKQATEEMQRLEAEIANERARQTELLRQQRLLEAVARRR